MTSFWSPLFLFLLSLHEGKCYKLVQLSRALPAGIWVKPIKGHKYLHAATTAMTGVQQKVIFSTDLSVLSFYDFAMQLDSRMICEITQRSILAGLDLSPRG